MPLDLENDEVFSQDRFGRNQVLVQFAGNYTARPTMQ